MHIVLVFLLPALFFTFVGYFIHMFREGVKSGIYQKTVAPEQVKRVSKKQQACGCGECSCGKKK